MFVFNHGSQIFAAAVLYDCYEIGLLCGENFVPLDDEGVAEHLDGPERELDLVLYLFRCVQQSLLLQHIMLSVCASINNKYLVVYLVQFLVSIGLLALLGLFRVVQVVVKFFAFLHKCCLLLAHQGGMYSSFLY